MKLTIIFMLFVMYLLYSTYVFADNSKMGSVFNCDKGILPQSSFIKVTKGKDHIENGLIDYELHSKLINTTNKCFKITAAEFIYLIDKDQAIYKVYTDDYSNPWIMIDFHKSPANLNSFKGVVKGVGKYTYKDDRGIPRNIPYMIVIK